MITAAAVQKGPRCNENEVLVAHAAVTPQVIWPTAPGTAAAGCNRRLCTSSGVACCPLQVQVLLDRHIPIYNFPKGERAARFAYKAAARSKDNTLKYWDKSVDRDHGYMSQAVTVHAYMTGNEPLCTINVDNQQKGIDLQLPVDSALQRGEARKFRG